MAITMGARISLASVLYISLAKQCCVTTYSVKHRNANSISLDLFTRSLLSRATQSPELRRCPVQRSLAPENTCDSTKVSEWQQDFHECLA